MELNLRQEGIVVPPSGVDFVPAANTDFTVTEPGGKCVHGVYIPANQQSQGHSEFCDICTSLKAYCEFRNISPLLADSRLYLWVNFEHEEALTRIKLLEEVENGRPETSDSPDSQA